MNPLRIQQNPAGPPQLASAPRAPEPVTRGYRELVPGARPDRTSTGVAAGATLVTGGTVAGIRISEPLATAVRHYLDTNDLTGPVIRSSGTHRYEIHLVTGLQRAERALAALATHVTVLSAGTVVVLPMPDSAGGDVWAHPPDPERPLPPVLAITAAVRAVLAARPGEPNPTSGPDRYEPPASATGRYTADLQALVSFP
ncbi:hypothetical protein [Nocardia sp. NPDC003963]